MTSCSPLPLPPTGVQHLPRRIHMQNTYMKWRGPGERISSPQPVGRFHWSRHLHADVAVAGK